MEFLRKEERSFMFLWIEVKRKGDECLVQECVKTYNMLSYSVLVCCFMFLNENSELSLFCGLLAEASAEEDFTGKAGQSTVLRFPGLGSKRVGLIALGSQTSSLAVFRSLGEAVASPAKTAQRMKDMPNRAPISVKRMGELDTTPFHDACRRKYPEELAEEKALEMCSLWEDYLRDPEWHPFNRAISSCLLNNVEKYNNLDSWNALIARWC